MPVKQPSLLDHSHYRRPVARATGGCMADTHQAIVLDEARKECRAFVKHFPHNQPKSLFNEWFGYCLMTALGIPQPPAAIMPAPRLGNPAQIEWAFVSFMPTPVCEGTPKEIYNYLDPSHVKLMAERLLKCPSFANMVSADQLCMNNDRNIGNIVFTGAKSFVVIDHNQILGGNNWQRNDLLKPTQWVRSVPIDVCKIAGKLNKSTANSLLASAEVIAEQLWECYAELHTTLTKSDTANANLALQAVWWRSLELAKWFKQELHLML